MFVCVYLCVPVYSIALLIVYTKEYTYIYISFLMAVAVGLLLRRHFALCFIFLFTLFLLLLSFFSAFAASTRTCCAAKYTHIYLSHIYIPYILPHLCFMATFHGNFISVNRQLARSAFSRFNQIHFTSLNRLIIY